MAGKLIVCLFAPGELAAQQSKETRRPARKCQLFSAPSLPARLRKGAICSNNNQTKQPCRCYGCCCCCYWSEWSTCLRMINGRAGSIPDARYPIHRRPASFDCAELGKPANRCICFGGPVARWPKATTQPRLTTSEPARPGKLVSIIRVILPTTIHQGGWPAPHFRPFGYQWPARQLGDKQRLATQIIARKRSL